MDEQGRKMSKSLGNVTAPDEVTHAMGADILRLWVMSSDTSEDMRIGKEILKQQTELYRRLRNTLRWLLGSLDGFTEAERVPEADMPELERWVLHRIAELDTLMRGAVESYDWTGVYAAIHSFCAADLSAFYFDIRKDALYCDRPDSLRRRASRTVLDHLHRALCTWLAPVLVFTAEEAWCARFGEADSVHLHDFPTIPAPWRDDALGAKWAEIRDLRRLATTELEAMRADKRIGSSNQAAITLALPDPQATLLSPEAWADILIVAGAKLEHAAIASARAAVAPGTKCDRCWKVLTEVGTVAAHPTLCLRCADAVDSGLVCRA
jgi:isoleucyl-tRNA synthetase